MLRTILAGFVFMTGLALGISEGGWFPVMNLIGVVLIWLSTTLIEED